MHTDVMVGDASPYILSEERKLAVVLERHYSCLRSALSVLGSHPRFLGTCL